VLKRGDVVTLDGSTGEVILGEVPLVQATSDQDFQAVRACMRVCARVCVCVCVTARMCRHRCVDGVSCLFTSTWPVV
jgi:hypothetical protein